MLRSSHQGHLRTPQACDLVSAYYTLTKEMNIDLGVKRLWWEAWGASQCSWIIRKITSLWGNWAASQMRTRMPDSCRSSFQGWLCGDGKVDDLFREGQIVAMAKHSGWRVKVGDEAKQWFGSRLEDHDGQDHFLNPPGTKPASPLSSMAEQRSRQTKPDHHAVS